MRKEIWVDCKHKGLEEMARLCGATGIIGRSKLGLKTLPEDIPVHIIKSREDIEKLPKSKYLIVEFTDWSIIPAENLIVKYPDTKIIVKTNKLDEVRTLATALEKGVHGFLVDNETALKEACSIYDPNLDLDLINATVTGIKRINLGKRACVDGIMTYGKREGLLVGASTSFMFLADAETNENPYVNTREWRVNAGAASLYTLCRRGGVITPRVLDDFVSGDDVIAVDAEGNTRVETVLRTKKEWRPMIYFQAEYEGKKGATCSQYAETVRFVTPDGSKPVTKIEKGDKIKVYVTETTATHFGTPAKERIEER